MHRHNTIVLRNSDEEITFADVSCMTDRENDRELREAISDAVQCWRRETEEGKQAWEASSEDFNIGDLVDHLDDPNLKRLLATMGVTDLHIDIHSFESYQPTAWCYDDVLGNFYEELY